MSKRQLKQKQIESALMAIRRANAAIQSCSRLLLESETLRPWQPTGEKAHVVLTPDDEFELLMAMEACAELNARRFEDLEDQCDFLEIGWVDEYNANYRRDCGPIEAVPSG